MKTKIKHQLTQTSFSSRQQEIIELLLQDRGLDPLFPSHPRRLTLSDLGIKTSQFNRALKLIKTALKAKTPIVIFGDYDVDGLTATAILWRFFHPFYSHVHPFIPDRFRHGYGLTQVALEEITQKHGPSLIITVDNGITAYQAIKFAQSQGHQVIVTDHHQPSKNKLPAQVIIHTAQVCGAGLAYVFARQLSQALGQSFPQPALAFAALGTIADLVPLLGFNRQFVYHGLQSLAQTKNPGLLALYQSASIEAKSISVGSVSFQLAPRLNASGRLGEAIDSLRLLCTNSQSTAQTLARKLNQLNFQRQQQTEAGLEHALAQVQPQDKLIFLCHEDYHQGVIGLIAGKLVEKHHLPAIVISQQENVSKASARSTKRINIIELIRSAESLLLSAGGHPQAAGFSVDTHKISQLKQTLLAQAQKTITDEQLQKTITADIQANPDDLNLSLAQKLNQLGPFGIGNPKPVFYTPNFNLDSYRWLGKNHQHLQLNLNYQQQNLSAIGFNHPQRKIPSQFGLFYQLDINQFRGRTKLQLVIKHLQKLPLSRRKGHIGSHTS